MDFALAMQTYLSTLILSIFWWGAIPSSLSSFSILYSFYLFSAVWVFFFLNTGLGGQTISAALFGFFMLQDISHRA